MRAVREPSHLAGTTDEVRVREDALLHGDDLARHQLRLLVVHAQHVVELARHLVQRQARRDGHRNLVNEVREPLQLDALEHGVEVGVRRVVVVAVVPVVARGDERGLVAVHVLKDVDAGVAGDLVVPADEDAEVLPVAVRLHPADRALEREDAVRRADLPRLNVRGGESLEGVAHVPDGAVVLVVPADHRGGHAVGDEAATALLLLHHQPVHLPPAAIHIRRSLRPAVVLPDSGLR